MKVSARDALRIAVPLLTGRALAPIVARFVALPTAMARARLPADGDADVVERAVAKEIVLGVEGLLRMIPRGSGTCLTRTLARTFALRRVGIPVRFVVGVTTDARGAPLAHSWLELDGAPFLEARPENLAQFHVIYADDVAGVAGVADVGDSRAETKS